MVFYKFIAGFRTVLFFELTLQVMGSIIHRNQILDTTFRIGAYNIPPFSLLTAGPNGTFTWTGSIPGVVLGMMEIFKMKYSVIPVNNSNVQQYGTTRSAINQIVNDEVDIAPAAFVASPERAQIMEFSFPIAMDSYRLLSPKSNEESRLFAFIGPFQPIVWRFFILAILAIIICLSWIAKMSRAFLGTDGISSSKTFSAFFGQYSIYVISTVTNQGFSFNVSFGPSRLMLMCWLLAATVLVNSYSGTLVSFLTLPKLKNNLNSFDDLAKSKDVNLLLGANTVLSQKILNAPSGIYRVLGDKVRKNPNSLMLIASDLNSRLETLTYAYPVVEAVCHHVIGSDFVKTGKCRFHLSNVLPYSQHGTMGLKKGGKFNKLLSYRMIQLWESGIIQFEIKRLNSKAIHCLGNEKRSARYKKIKLINMTSAFFVLGLSIACSILIFVIEASIGCFLKSS